MTQIYGLQRILYVVIKIQLLYTVEAQVCVTRFVFAHIQDSMYNSGH